MIGIIYLLIGLILGTIIGFILGSGFTFYGIKQGWVEKDGYYYDDK